MVIELTADIKRLLQGGDEFSSISGLINQLEGNLQQVEKGYEKQEYAIQHIKDFNHYLMDLKVTIPIKRPKAKKVKPAEEPNEPSPVEEPEPRIIYRNPPAAP